MALAASRLDPPAAAIRAEDRSGRRAFHGFALGSTLLMMGLLATVPDPSGQVALVYPPGTGLTEAVSRAAAAGARVIRPGRADWILVVAPDAADFRAQAYAGGALAILNPVIAGDCTPAPSPSPGTRP